MADEAVRRLTDLLVDAREDGLLLGPLPAEARLSSLAEGIAVQAAVERRLGRSVGGWKVGIPPGAPTYRAPIYVPDIVSSPAAWLPPAAGTLMVEGELAFTLGRDLPPREGAYTEAEVVEAVQSACVAIEIVRWRVDLDSAAIAERVGDHLGNEGLVVGPPVTGWRSLDRTAIHAALEVNGAVVEEKTGAKTGAAEPVALLVWLANHLMQRGGLKAGEIVTTGTWTGSRPVGPGDRISVRLSGLGSAEATFG